MKRIKNAIGEILIYFSGIIGGIFLSLFMEEEDPILSLPLIHYVVGLVVMLGVGILLRIPEKEEKKEE